MDTSEMKAPPVRAEKLVISPALFDGIRYADYGKRFDELGIKEHYKRGLKKDILIKKAIAVLSEIEAKRLAGEDTEKISEEAAKADELAAAEKDALAQEAEAKAIADKVKQEATQEIKQEEKEQAYADILKGVDVAILKNALKVTKANLKDALLGTRTILLMKSEAIEAEIASR